MGIPIGTLASLSSNADSEIYVLWILSTRESLVSDCVDAGGHLCVLQRDTLFSNDLALTEGVLASISLATTGLSFFTPLAVLAWCMVRRSAPRLVDGMEARC